MGMKSILSCRCLLLFCFLVFSGSPAQATVLGDAARTLAVGSWVQLSAPSGIGAALGSTGLTSGHVLTYGMDMPWNETNQSLYNCSNDHLVPHKCAKYTESTHAWTVLATPPFAQDSSHAWDHQVIDIYNQRYYHIPAQPSGSIEAYYCDLAGNPTCTSWTTINNFDNDLANGSGTQAIGWAPWLGNQGRMVYVFASGGSTWDVKTYDPQTSGLVLLGQIPTSTSNVYPALSTCTVHAPFLCYLGITGSGSGKFYTVNSSGTLTARATPPCDLHWNESDSVIEPVSGRLLTMCGSSNAGLWAYNNTTNAWTQLSSGLTPPQTFTSTSNPVNNGVMLASIPEHGVILAIASKQTAGSTDANHGMWIYKYADSWTYRSTATGVLNAQGFDSTTIFNTQVNQTNKTDGFTITGDPDNVRDTTIFASGASSWKCHFGLNIGTNPCANYWGYTGQGGSNVSFSQNSELWFQYAFRPDSTWTSLNWNEAHNPKLHILHYQFNSCANIEFTLINTSTKNAPTSYFDCGAKPLYSSDGTTYNAFGQYGQQGWVNSPQGYQCAYTSGEWNTPNCFNWVHSQFATMTFRLRIGTWGSANSTVEAWVQSAYGKRPRKFLHVGSLTLNHDGVPGNGFDVIELTQFMTSSTTNPVMDVWYDELIISTSPINPSAGVAGSTSGGPSTPAIPTNVRVQ